ncbi:MAG: hypothetical protein GC136_02870 [Alphaproteobacteria bacterium]|nr:hypothetical protein [Alphaproteobacteria bacterium]
MAQQYPHQPVTKVGSLAEAIDCVSGDNPVYYGALLQTKGIRDLCRSFSYTQHRRITDEFSFFTNYIQGHSFGGFASFTSGANKTELSAEACVILRGVFQRAADIIDPRITGDYTVFYDDKQGNGGDYHQHIGAKWFATLTMGHDRPGTKYPEGKVPPAPLLVANPAFWHGTPPCIRARISLGFFR